jgi:hypothetical protein
LFPIQEEKFSIKHTKHKELHTRITRLSDIYIIFFHWFYSPLGPWPLIFSFMIILDTAGLFRRVISSSQGLCLNTVQHKHRINTHTYQISMPCVGYEPTIPAFEQAKTVHVLDRSAIVIGIYIILVT